MRGMSRSERLKFLYRKKLCYGCYQADHKADKCDSKCVCDICKESHPTGLHKDIPEEVQEGTSGKAEATATLYTVSQVEEVVSMCVIQV